MSCSSSTLPETPRTRSKRLRLDQEGNSTDTVTADAEHALLCEDLVLFGQLPLVKKAINEISEVHGGCGRLKVEATCIDLDSCCSHYT